MLLFPLSVPKHETFSWHMAQQGRDFTEAFTLVPLALESTDTRAMT